MHPSPASTDDSIDLECGLNPPQPSSRRQLERELVLRFDSRELRHHEAWFLVETVWLDAWMSYVLGDPDDAMAPKPPGPLNNDSLFDRQEFKIKSGLQATKDYRGVNPQVYAVYTELYGTQGAKPIVRWTLDIYAMPVMIDDVREMLHAPELRARAAVSELNESVASGERGLRRRRRDAERETWAYRCLCRCEFLVPCLNRLLGGGPTYKKEEKSWWQYCCGARKNKKRKRSKKKRRTDDEDTDSDEGSSDEETHGLLG
ncbi:hypothetical protein PHYBOEH_001404 [Phytophthora boehmeriae]|uniref:DUSP domain-containing protein n=1 Tax=Phytophthora boehmeriae TaxID=109152 RepID=A0A8T1X5E3_9STRA|nr:hypothetical protein PHYBOEH_001404 [Phytophthora boehmeriae]